MGAERLALGDVGALQIGVEPALGGSASVLRRGFVGDAAEIGNEATGDEAVRKLN